MAYEFTKQKLVKERKASALRVVVTVLAAAAGLALGSAVNDMNSFWGLLAASLIAMGAGLLAHFMTGT